MDHSLYSDSVLEVESLVQQLQDDLNYTNITQQRITQDLTVVHKRIEETQEQIQQV